jgi:hypothetical protein
VRWTSIVAIYSLFWVFAAFLVMPFGIRTHDELGMGKVDGQAHSAPGNFRPSGSRSAPPSWRRSCSGCTTRTTSISGSPSTISTTPANWVSDRV